MRISDWSSDVCSSDLGGGKARRAGLATIKGARGSRAELIGCVGRVERDGHDVTVATSSSNGRYGAKWNGGDLLRIGDHRLWVDRRGRLRIKAGTPSSDDDGQALSGRSEEHTSELQSLMRSSYAVVCLKKK